MYFSSQRSFGAREGVSNIQMRGIFARPINRFAYFAADVSFSLFTLIECARNIVRLNVSGGEEQNSHIMIFTDKGLVHNGAKIYYYCYAENLMKVF